MRKSPDAHDWFSIPDDVIIHVFEPRSAANIRLSFELNLCLVIFDPSRDLCTKPFIQASFYVNTGATDAFMVIIFKSWGGWGWNMVKYKYKYPFSHSIHYTDICLFIKPTNRWRCKGATFTFSQFDL